MLRSKSRSGSVEFGQKNHYSSVFSRTLSASKLCKGGGVGTQIDANAHKFAGRKSNLSSKADRVMSMQQQMSRLENGLETSEETLSEATKKANQSLSSRKASELMMEIENLKKMQDSAKDELKRKDERIDSLEVELGKAREIEGEKNESLGMLMKEIRDAREREKGTMELLLQYKKRIQDLETEVERKRKSESKMADSLAVQNVQLDSTLFELEESNIEIVSLHEKIDGLEDLCHQISRDDDIKGLKSELELAKENLVKAQEGEKKALLKVEKVVEEMEAMKKECMLAVDGEEKSTKALEDLALALKEVATEANQAKEKLGVAEDELQLVKQEAEKMKETMNTNEERYQNLLNEAKQETELYKNTADRLRIEAEESLFAWNGKEMGFVSCIKRAEEERAMAQHENQKLSESLQAAREETYKLRDLLKQAVNEANAAKSAAGIAREENSSLKDILAEKEEALLFTTRENERLRISEAAAQENVKQLKKMLVLASSESNTDDKDTNVLMFHDVDEEIESNKMTRAFSFDLEDLRFMNEQEDEVLDEDPEKAEALKGSIFDANAETPKSEVRTPKAAAFKERTYSFAFSEDEETPNYEDFDNLNSSQEEVETEKQQHTHRRSKSMLQRVGALGGLLTIRRSFQRKESGDLKTPTGHKKELPTDPKTPPAQL